MLIRIDPFKPPIMKFDTKVYHPNISSQTGAICLDILKDAWTPILTLKSSMISLQSLLQSPEPNDPQDAQVANHYIKDLNGFKQTAAWVFPITFYGLWTMSNKYNRQWTSMYAQANNEVSHAISPQVINAFVDMGFPKEKVILVLQNLGIKEFSSDNRPSEENRIMEALLSM